MVILFRSITKLARILTQLLAQLLARMDLDRERKIGSEYRIANEIYDSKFRRAEM